VAALRKVAYASNVGDYIEVALRTEEASESFAKMRPIRKVRIPARKCHIGQVEVTQGLLYVEA